MPSFPARTNRLHAGLLLLVAASTAAGCGGSGSPSPTSAERSAPAAVRLVDTVPRSGVYAIAGARQVPAGATRLTVRNRGPRERGAQVVRVEGRRGERAVVAAVRAAAEGRGLPPWLHWAGGMGVLRPNSRATVTVDLRPGRHYIVDRSYEGRQPEAAAGQAARLEVTRSKEKASLPGSDATITARDYAFRARGLRAGRRLVALRNAGAQPHDFAVAPILPGRTLDDVRAFAGGDESGPPPVDFAREVISGVLAPGMAQTIELDLRPGRYALLCFATDREGGPPHVVRGMLGETRVP